MRRFILLFLNSIAVYACTPEPDFSGGQASAGQCVVEFTPVTVSTPVVTKGTTYIPKDSKMMIAAYGVVSGMESTNFADTVRYKVSNSVGSIIPMGEKDMILYKDSTYRFYGYSPAASFNTNSTKTLNVANGTDFILTSTKATFNELSTQVVQFPAMDHQCSYVEFTLKLNPANTDVTTLAVGSEGLRINRMSHSPMSYNLSTGFNRDNIILDGLCRIDSASFSETETNTFKGGIPVLPKDNGSFDLQMDVYLNGERCVALGTVPAMALEPGKKYLFNVTFADGGINVALTVLPWNEVADSSNYGETTIISITNWTVKPYTTELGNKDLGSEETANSYITFLNNTIYRFNATIMGNGAITPQSVCGTQTAPAIVPATLNPQNAFVLWETGSKGSVIQDGSVTLNNGYVFFKTANNTTNGNAVIAVTGTGGEIIWSWHIWKVNYNPDIDYDTYSNYPVGSGSFKMMKYNLGATGISNWSGSATNAGDLGLLYQWGRKDPFVGISGWSDGTFISRSFAGGYSYTAVSSQSNADASITYAIGHPHQFIKYTGYTTYDWLASTYATQRNNLWGNPNTTTTLPNPSKGSKSIYDPCPPGWRVPSQDCFQIFKSDGTNDGIWNHTDSNNNGYTFYITAYKTGPTSYWPALGYIAKEDGIVKQVNSYDPYWTSASNTYDDTKNYYAGFFNSAYSWNNGVLYSSSRGDAYSIRCMKE